MLDGGDGFESLDDSNAAISLWPNLYLVGNFFTFEYTQTIGHYCWKPCDRDGQLALIVGCGLTPLDRTCHASSGDCAIKYVNHALSVIDVLTTILSEGVAGAFKTAIKVASKAGT